MDEKMSLPVMVFDLKAKMAHFRKFYSNSSCLSYFIPPRTTIAGIVAGILGRSRDEYYEEFSLERCQVTVSPISPVKKIIQKMNYLHIEDSLKKLGISDYPSQTPTEIVIPQNIRNRDVGYRIWLHHQEGEILQKLESLLGSTPAYLSKGIALALGSAQHLGWIEYLGCLQGEVIDEQTEATVSSVIPREVLASLQVEKMKEGVYYLVKEDVPLEFDRQRRITPKGKGDMIINLNGLPVPAVVKRHVKLSDGTCICWME